MNTTIDFKTAKTIENMDHEPAWVQLGKTADAFHQ